MRQRGSIREMGEGRFRIAIYLGVDANGKRKYYYETIHCSNKKEAQKYLTQKLNEIDNGTFIKPANMTLREYLDEWEENALKARVRPKTYKSYKRRSWLYSSVEHISLVLFRNEKQYTGKISEMECCKSCNIPNTDNSNNDTEKQAPGANLFKIEKNLLTNWTQTRTERNYFAWFHRIHCH